MKVRVCDKCYREKKKLVETPRTLIVKGLSLLNLDLCPDCLKVVKAQYPKVTPEYAQYAMMLLGGHEVSLDAVTTLLKMKARR